MSEGHAEPPADVRSFLPRPGEPVEEYAQRLRALHRDLTLVLQAVERGLAAAASEEAPADETPPSGAAPGGGFAAPLAEADLTAATAAPPLPARGPAGAGARVEVMPAPAGAARRAPDEEHRGSASAAPPPEYFARPDHDFAAERRAEHTASLEDADRAHDPRSSAPAAFPARPSARPPEPGRPGEPAWLDRLEKPVAGRDPVSVAAHGYAAIPRPSAAPHARVEEHPRPPVEREQPWIERSSAPAWAPDDLSVADRPAARGVPPVLLAAALTGWLVVVALILVLALD